MNICYILGLMFGWTYIFGIYHNAYIKTAFMKNDLNVNQENIVEISRIRGLNILIMSDFL